MKPQKQQKPYWEMNREELAEATKQFDEEFVADRGRPLNAEEREEDRLARAKNPGGRPRVGNGSVRVNITIESGLLRKTDAIAKREKIGRSELIARSLKSTIADSKSVSNPAKKNRKRKLPA
jgi:hypothetical protein